MSVQELKPDQLRRICDLEELAFETTDDLDDLEGLLGQPRAVAAIEFGVSIEREGYNIFAFGPDGTGKHSAVRQILEERAARRPVPPDLCYVHDFAEPHRPRLLSLPAGRGRQLRQAMEHLVEELHGVLRAALESEEHQTQRQALKEQFEERQNRALSQLGDEAQQAGLGLMRTSMGLVIAPQKGDEVLAAEALAELPEEEQQRIHDLVESFKEKLQKLMRQFPRWKRETRDKLRQLELAVSRFAIEPLISDVREQFADLPAVLDYLEAVEDDVVENSQRQERAEAPVQELMKSLSGKAAPEPSSTRRYLVNVLVDHGGAEGAPVVYEDNPTYPGLVGRVEHLPQMGAMVTDFSLIKAGALHKANGGYLLLDATKLLSQPYAWDGLKRALRAHEIKIESLGQAMSLLTSYSLEPQPTPLDLKITLLGDARLYALLSQLDPDFSELFKVAADFGEQLDWNRENLELYARLIAKLAHTKELRPFDRSAVGRLVENGARSLGDSRKLSLFMGKVLDLMREADFWAGKADHPVAAAEDVQRAIDARIFRSDRMRQRIQEAMLRETVLVDTSSSAVGQVNGLAVAQIGDFPFGRPSRITARVRLGKGEVIDIEREVELSGPLHSKGVLILSGFLGARFAAERPLSLSASLVFEQSYGGIDGDSASSAELYALLSAIAEVPLKQSLAVTGSVNQLGQVQAIGGATEKIEGFFDLCSARGLTGDQGVLVPDSNVQHLMLRDDVVEAVAGGRFHIYPVATIDQGIELLTGLEAGARDAGGEYPADSLNRLVEDRLIRLAETVQRFASAAPGEGDPTNDESPH
jgi:predicted ATP-dependent protease